MQTTPLRMRPGTRTILQVVSVVLIVGGLGLFLSGFLVILDLDSADPGPGFILRLMLGVVLFGAGNFLARLAFLKPVSELVATETEGAVRHAGKRVAHGVGDGLTASGIVVGAPREVVKIRCRSCGALDTEDARFCSACGHAI